MKKRKKKNATALRDARLRRLMLGLFMEHKESDGKDEDGRWQGTIEHIDPKITWSPVMADLLRYAKHQKLNWQIELRIHWENKSGHGIDHTELIARDVKLDDLTELVKEHFAEMRSKFDPKYIVDKSWSAKPFHKDKQL